MSAIQAASTFALADERLYRAGKLWEIGAGTTEIRQVIIAGELLGR